MARELGQVLEAVLDGAIVLDARGLVEHVNTQACRMLAISVDGSRGYPLEQIPGGATLAPLARASLEQGTSAVAYAQDVERREGQRLPMDVASSPLFDPAGGVDGVVLLLRDRTIGDSLHRMWTERERLATFGRIASGIAHEVKNPLGGIRGAAELLHGRAKDEKSKEIAELIVREVERIATLLDDFLVFSRGDSLRMQPVNLHRVLDDVLSLLAMDPVGTRAQVERRFDPSIPELLADPDRLTQVFLNLARNALEAMAKSPEARLTIATRMSLDHRLDLGDGQRVPTVAVEIQDTGHGIPNEIRDQVATPFFTTKSGGTGLGLALARHFVTLHDGSLHIESEPGRGATVRVVLPLRRTS